MGFLVSIFTVGINLKSFPGLYTPYKKPLQFAVRSDMGWQQGR